jgi:CheY-like chemotaxis protein
VTLLPPRRERAEAQVGAIAHELNNVLTVVRTYTHFARQPTTQEQRAQDLMVVAAAAERAGALVDWLSSSSERAPRAADELSANAFVSAATARLQQLISPGTSVEIMRVGDDVSFRANALRLEHVVMSLVLAASQRSAETAFKFAVERATVSEDQVLGLVPGQYVLLVITCANVTTSSAWREAPTPATDQVAVLLDPLGDLLQTMNGKLEALSTPEGTVRFQIFLPVVPASLASTPVPKPRLALVPPGVYTICIVEDETPIREAMVRGLAGAGYLVLEADDGVAARALLIVHGAAVNLLICDLGLLQGGEEFFAWVKVTCPRAAVLLVSGNAPQGEAKASSLRAHFLPKPFTPSQLRAAVRSTIAHAEACARTIAGGERVVVLIVDDEEVIRDSFVRLLAECDFELVVAKTGLHALQILAERRVDAVVADQFMPGLDGIGLLELVRERFPDCVRILCTAHPASDIIVAAIDRGRVHRVLPKTMHAVALRDEIERAVLQTMQER